MPLIWGRKKGIYDSTVSTDSIVSTGRPVWGGCVVVGSQRNLVAHRWTTPEILFPPTFAP